MIKQFSGLEQIQTEARKTGSAKLPAGPYVCQIKGVKYDEEHGFIKIQFDVAEGEYKDFYTKQYKESKDENKKYKGVVTVWLPKDDGSEKDGWTKKTFANWINAVEDSNSGYKWTWDETTLKGKKIGLMFGEVGKNIDGKDVTYTECRFPISVEAAKSGKVKTPEFYAYKGYGTAKPATTGTDFMNIPSDLENELPF